MEQIPGRNIAKGQKVRVYVNLNKQGRFSIVDMKSGLVCAYTENCLLSDVQFFVSPTGRKKVLEAKRKMVHAWVKGVFEGSDVVNPPNFKQPVNYNPYKHEAFIDESGNHVFSAEQAFLTNKKVYIP